MLGIGADVAGAVGMLDDIVDRLDRPARVQQQLAGLMGEYVQEVFDSKGGGQWPGLDADTIRIKGSSRVMVDTGGLLDALTHPTVIDDDTVTTTAPEYAQYPARRRDPAPEPPAQVIDQWAEVLADHIVEGR